MALSVAVFGDIKYMMLIETFSRKLCRNNINTDFQKKNTMQNTNEEHAKYRRF